jgi:hypothetical protein
MDFEHTVTTINELLQRKAPPSFNSSWILKHAPHCYHFIRKNIRTEAGQIDWDRLTAALDRKYQRLWTPRQWKKPEYKDPDELDLILRQHRHKLYAFIASQDAEDRRARDIAAIALVRLSQRGNALAKEELICLAGYTIDEWIDRCDRLACWKGRDGDVRQQLDACIRRYRYTGSFLNYVFRTLEYAGRGIRPLHTLVRWED